MGGMFGARRRANIPQDRLGLLDSVLVGAASALIATVPTMLAIDAWTPVNLVARERLGLLVGGMAAGVAISTVRRLRS